MARRDEALELLRSGVPPSEIARQMNTTPNAVMHHLHVIVGEGRLRRSDLAFAIPRELRAAIEAVVQQTGITRPAAIVGELRRRGISANRMDVAIYIEYRRAGVVLGDMYELVRIVELRLHTFIRQAFIAEFGEEHWWRSGVPDSIRAECAALREKDPEPAEDAYAYTHLIDVRDILDKRWPVLMKYLPKHLLNQKRELLERVARLNRIRNAVMHPVRNRPLTEEEFEFVRDFERDLDRLVVQSKGEVANARAEMTPQSSFAVDSNDESAAPTGKGVDDTAAESRPERNGDAFMPGTKTA